MAKYSHSTYWYVKKSGKTLPAGTSYTKEFIDGYLKLPIWGFPRLEAGLKYDPYAFTVCVMADIGRIMAREVKRIVDPVERERIKEELQKMVRKLRRTLSNMPTVEDIKEAWEKRKTSKSAMIHQRIASSLRSSQ